MLDLLASQPAVWSRDGKPLEAERKKLKQNVEFEIEGDQLVIRVDLSQELGVSSSGKSVIIATTGGNVAVPGWEAVKVGLNVYRPQQAGRTSRRMASQW